MDQVPRMSITEFDAAATKMQTMSRVIGQEGTLQIVLYLLNNISLFAAFLLCKNSYSFYSWFTFFSF